MDIHVHNADPSIGPVCTSMLTQDMLDSWGFVMKLTDKIMGTCITTREGMAPRKARQLAAEAGLTVTCTLPPPERWPNPVQSDESCAESLAWVALHKRTEEAAA